MSLYNKIIDEIDNIDEEEMDWRTIDEDGPFDDYDPSDDQVKKNSRLYLGGYFFFRNY